MKNKEFEKRNRIYTNLMSKDLGLKRLSKNWIFNCSKYEYSYHFSWLGRPIIQFPQDIIAVQELIWKVKPDLIIETGIARGGSLIFSASILELLGHGKVVGIDIDIRKHNKKAIESHPLHKRIIMFEGSSIDETIAKKVYRIAKGKKRVLVFLDSNHTSDHVFKELNLYSPLVKKGSYVIVFDTLIEEIPRKFYKDLIKGPWNEKDNPKTAVREFLKSNNRFKIDHQIEKKLLITVSPSGYLKCVK